MIAPRDAIGRIEVDRSCSPRDPAIGWTPTLFRRRAASQPGLIAIEGPRRSLSYEELDRRTDAMAERLRRKGVGRGVLVGLILPRSIEAIVAMLAVMKARGAFLPIDPDYPTARQAFLLKDSEVPIVLSTADRAPGLPVSGARVVTLDDLGKRLGMGGPGRLGRGEPDDLAYAIYTSGSTGRPKAALLTHRGIGPLAEAQGPAFGIGPGTRVLQFASPGFDAIISEVFVTLLRGGTVCVAGPGDLVPGEALSQTLLRRRIEVATLPPSVVALLPRHAYPALKTLVVAGEACPASLASEWSVGRRLINAYGPTEATVCASLYICPEGPQPAPPIGRPLPHVDARVLGPSGEPVPDGEPGELCLGGPALAEGYLRRPRLTADRFVVAPSGDDGHRRIYRTGDRVRRLGDGTLEFLGRLDEQVKIRGIRIEPAEIREAIEAHPLVRAAAVLPEGEGRGLRLAAFVVPEPSARLSEEGLRAHLRRHLPIHLIPGRIRLVDRLPLTPHGKLDRRALIREGAAPSPADRRGDGPRSPRDATELMVARAWEEVLGRREVGIDDDFFASGGDSLSALELLARLQRRSGVGLPLSALLAGPTVASLAAALAERRAASRWSPLVPIRPEGTRPPIYCIHPGGGNVLCYVDLARALGDDQPIFGLQAPGVDDDREPLTSVDAMATAYLDAIESARPAGPLRLCGWSFGGVVAFEMARRLALLGRPPDRLILIDAGFLHCFAILRALIPVEQPLVRFLGADRERIFPEFRRHAVASRIVPPGATEGQIRRIFGVFMANVEALYSYRPGPYDGGRITLLMAEERITDPRRDPIDEWRSLCGDLEVVPVPGNHLTMMSPPHVAALAEAVADRLGRPCDGEPIE